MMAGPDKKKGLKNTVNAAGLNYESYPVIK